MNSININLSISLIVLIIVFILEYIFKLIPCDMCLVERYPYYALILLSIIAMYLVRIEKAKLRKIIDYVSISAILFGFIYTLRHVGVERGIIKLSTECSGALINTSDKSALLEELNQAALVRCDEATYLFNFISIAESNLILMTFLLFINIYFLVKK
jgi:disulfide bond formation protein DsbB